MSLETDVRAALAAPSETTALDFKERIDWGSLRSQIELVRDIVCLSNRNGGLLIVGVKDLGGGRFEPIGLSDEDVLPDPTDLGKLLRKYFDPPAALSTAEFVIGEKRFAVIRVEEFGRLPVVCKAIGNDEKGRAVVRPGYIYRRSNALECAVVDTAAAMSEVLEAAVAKSGAFLRVLATPAPNDPEPGRSVGLRLPQEDTYRTCDLAPESTGRHEEGVLSLLNRISRSVVRSHGGVIVPRSIDPSTMSPSAIIREPARVVIERIRDQDESYYRATSFIEVSRSMHVHIREGLWEEEGTIDYTSMFAFVFGCLLFAKRFYENTGVDSISVRIGIARPSGRRLVDDPTRFTGFHQTYVATSSVDLVVARTITTTTLNDAEDREHIAKEIISELGEFFGFALNEQAYSAHLDHVAVNVPGVKE